MGPRQHCSSGSAADVPLAALHHARTFKLRQEDDLIVLASPLGELLVHFVHQPTVDEDEVDDVAAYCGCFFGHPCTKVHRGKPVYERVCTSCWDQVGLAEENRQQVCDERRRVFRQAVMTAMVPIYTSSCVYLSCIHEVDPTTVEPRV